MTVDDSTFGSRDPAKSDRGFGRRLAWIVGLAAVVRLAHLITKWNRPLLLNDSVWYSSMAAGLRNGEFFQHLVIDGTPSAEHPPLAAILMTPGSFLPNWVQGQRLTTVVAGIIGVLLIGLLGRKIGGAQVGLAAASIAAVYPNLWLNDSLVMSESIAITVVLGALLLLHRLLERPHWTAALALGLLLGAAALTRSELLLLTPLAVILLIAHGRRTALATAAVVLCAAVVTIMPWVVVNFLRFERPVLLTTNDGTTLLGSYCDDIFYGANKGGWSVFCVLDAPETAGDDSVRSAEQRSIAISYARHHLSDVPGVVIARVARTLDLYGLDDMVHGDVGEEKPRMFVWAGIVSWWLLLMLAVVGFTLTRRRDRWLLALPIITTATATVVFYGGHRLRAPAEPAVVIFASVALCALWQRRQHSRMGHGGSYSADSRGNHASDSVSSGGSQEAVGGAHLDPASVRTIIPPLTGHVLLARRPQHLFGHYQLGVDRWTLLSRKHNQHRLHVALIEFVKNGYQRVGGAIAAPGDQNHQGVGRSGQFELWQLRGQVAHVGDRSQLDQTAATISHVRDQRLMKSVDGFVTDDGNVARPADNRWPQQPHPTRQNGGRHQQRSAMAGYPHPVLS